ncbi:SDR family NAD(P)-dependent oxidoreductase [Actinomadura luteofluorescens]|uniref:SDR family NAD(P)-dependent oxidoreductase n=1 Tax=Actinomadura luteofluorescens TaxID=46163 RepID=UPI0030CB24A8
MTVASDAIAVVGLGCRHPDAATPEQLWETVMARRRAFRPLPRERLDLGDYGDPAGGPDTTDLRYAAVLDGWSFDRSRHRVPGPAYRVTDLAHWLALDVAGDTLTSAGHPEGRGLDRRRAGVILGNTLTGEFSRAALMRLRWPYVRRNLVSVLAARGWEAEELGGLLREVEASYKEPFAEPNDESLVGGLANAIAGRVCNHFDFRGAGYTVDGACSSSLLAVITACTYLRDGDLDFALAGGVDLSLDPFELVGFSRLGALAGSAMRVYDARPTGFLPGEGCSMVALMRAGDAAAAGRRPIALIKGWGMSSDGNGGLTRPDVSGQRLALERAYARAGFGPETVALFEGHGTGTEVGDRAELHALSEIHDGRRGPRPAALGSIKANIGHTKAAAGAAGLIKAALALRRQVIPPTTGCDEPHPLLCEPGAPLRVVREAEPWPDAPLRAGVSAMGFGGINTHVVLEAADVRRTTARLATRDRRVAREPLDCEVFALSAGTDADLAAVLERVAARAATMSFAEHADLAAALAERAHGDAPVRAAIVARDPAELSARAERAGELLAGLGARGFAARPGVYVGRGAPGRVGLLFPGQGAPVRDRAGALGVVLPETGEYFEEGLLEDPVDTAVAQPAVLRASTAALHWLDRLGVAAAAAVGHSLGEITALHWAGALSRRDALHLVTRRGRIMADHSEAGTGMASLAAPPGAVTELIDDADLVIAADNGAVQVVAGPLTEVDRVVKRARAKGITAGRLRVSHAFHSPAVAAAEPVLARHLADLEVAGLPGRVYSTITGRELTAADDVRALLARQLTAPVRFREALELLAADCDLLVEAGPGHTLTAMAQSVTDVPVRTLDAGAGSAAALGDATAALFAVGAVSDLTALFAERFHRPFDLWRDPEFLANPCESAPADGLDGRSGRSGRPAPDAAAPAGPATAAAPAAEAPPGADTDVPSVVRGLIAEALELPPDVIGDGDRLLGDLHLNSLRVVQLAAEAAERTRRAVPAAPPLFAEATVGAFVQAIEELPAAEGETGSQGPPEGVREWHRVLVEFTRPVELDAEPASCTWRVFGGGRLRALVEPRLAALPEQDARPAVVAFLPEDPDDRAIDALLEAAHLAVDAGAPFTVVDSGDTASGFAGTIAAEYPSLPVRWIRVLETAPADAIGALLAASWQGHSEIVVDEDGRIGTPAYRAAGPAQTGRAPDAAPPLSAGDVLVVTGGGKGIGFASACFLARRWGVRLGLIGRSGPDGDAELRDNLARLREAGVEFCYQPADVTDPESLHRGVAVIVDRLGPVRGVIHASGLNRPARFGEIGAAWAEHAAPKHHGLRALLGAVDAAGLRLLLTFGSVIGRFGLAGEAHYALANGRMRELVRTLARDLPDCRVANLDWTVWSGVGMGERLKVLDDLARAGVAPVAPDRGTELLARAAEARPPSYSMLISGRLPQLGRAGEEALDGHRFLRRVRAWTPGVELVAEAELSLSADPYLDDHRIDGVAVLPAVCVLEAMAQAAAALTGRPVAGVADSRFDRPVVVPEHGTRTVRVCALVREDGDVDVAVRSDETGFAVDHFTGTVASADSGPPEIPAGSSPVPAHTGDDMYGPLFFHGRRFRRLRRYTHLEATACTAVLDGDRPWRFGEGLPTDLLFGDPARNDASIHVLQGCVPHRRLLPVGCARFAVHRSGAGEGELTLAAVEREHSGADYTYDVVVRDGSGRPVVSWSGLRLRDVGPLPVTALHPVVVGPYLQRTLDALLPERDLRLAVEAAGPDREYTSGGPWAVLVDGEPVACARTSDPAPEPPAHWNGLADRLGRLAGEPEQQIRTRLQTVGACLSGPPGPPGLTVQGVYENGWVVLQTGGADIVSVVLSVEGEAGQVAMAIPVKGAS